MPNDFVETSIEINAPVSKVWRVLTDLNLTRQMGGEYVSEWRVGSSFGWKVSTVRCSQKAREDFSRPASDEEHAAAMEGWEAALQSVKEIAEKE
jgi:uncharacterized protein YndB with AHSA1/START domain